MAPTMLLLSLATALASEPAVESIHAVQAVTWAQPFTLGEPVAYSMRGDQPTVRSGAILQLLVQAGMGRARAVDQPVLYVGAYPARVMNPSSEGTCLIVWAPTEGPLDQTPIYFGRRTLPERVDAAAAQAQLADAVAAGAPVFAAKALDSVLAADTLEPVWAAAQGAVERCK